MAGKSQHSSLPLPSPAQIALALITVRSKPSHITVEEHLRDIRQSIVTGAAQQGRSAPKHIDASHFWKDAFLRSQQEKQALQDELSVLQHRVQKFQGTIKTSAKRKAESSVVNKANTHSKRRRTERESSDEETSYRNAESEQSTHPAIQRVLRVILSLLKPGSSNNSSQQDIATNIQLLCHDLGDCLQSASACSRRMQEDSTTLTLAKVCPPIVSSHKLLLSKLLHVPSAADADFDLGRITSSIVALYRTLLDTLYRLALDETRRSNEEQASKKKKPQSNTKVTKNLTEHGVASFELSAALLVRTLQHMVAAFDLDNVHHCALFKNMLSVLLDHAGSALSLLVFADPQNTGAGETLTELPGRWRQDSDRNVSITIAATEVEAPYVLGVLRFTLRLLREREYTLPIRSREIIGGTLTDIDNEMLSHKIEQRLQATLMRGVFGRDDEDFIQAFTRPSTPDGDEIDKVLKDARAENNRSEWFIGQIWELLGWDILSGRMATAR